MEKIKGYLRLVFCSRLILDSEGRTMMKIPLWLLLLVAADSFRFALLAAILTIAMGMQIRIEKG